MFYTIFIIFFIQFHLNFHRSILSIAFEKNNIEIIKLLLSRNDINIIYKDYIDGILFFSFNNISEPLISSCSNIFF